VTDLRPEAEKAFNFLIDGARSPEDAAQEALGFEVVRSSSKANLVARVHGEHVGQEE
jgi:hypothetical protein